MRITKPRNKTNRYSLLVKNFNWRNFEFKLQLEERDHFEAKEESFQIFSIALFVSKLERDHPRLKEFLLERKIRRGTQLWKFTNKFFIRDFINKIFIKWIFNNKNRNYDIFIKRRYFFYLNCIRKKRFFLI